MAINSIKHQGGKRPTPTALKVLKGEKPSRINFDEPQPASQEPPRPAFPDAEMAEVWDFTTRELRKLKILAECDRDMLYAFCVAVYMHRKATREVVEYGLVSGTPSGRETPSAAVRIVQETAGTIAKLATHFGLSPAARTAIKVGAATGEGDGHGTEKYLTG